MPNNSKLQIAMFPWFAYGHMIPFLHLANEFAKRGHTISFLLPNNVISKLANNRHSHLITFHALTLPPVPGLAPGAETTADAKDSFVLSAAMDGTKDQVRAILEKDKPNFVFFDFAYWVPDLAPEIGFKTVYFKVMSPTTSALKMVMSASKGRPLTAADILTPPPGYPSSSNVTLREHEARKAALFANAHADELRKFFGRSAAGLRNCDLLAVRTVKETEGIYCDYLATQYRKPVLCIGAVLPEPREDPLEDKISIWLTNFKPNSVVFCAFGSEWVLEKPQFQQLLLGLEQTNLPFLVALKPPKGTSSIEEALPEGFQERVQNRGLVYGGWVPQSLILAHKSIGCFVNHCGYGSMWESLMSDCQLVFVPNILDQSLNTRLMADELKVAVEVERDENGWFSKESICKAVKSVMDSDNQIGCLVRENHSKWKKILTRPGFMSEYVDNFIQYLQGLV